MALLTLVRSALSNVIYGNSALTKLETRNLYTKPRAIRDMKRRKLVKEFAPTRLRYVAMKRNNILPKELQDLASKAFDDIPRQSSLRQLTPRCVITSRGYGTVRRWRISRFLFRHLADYNQLSGVQRAIW